MNESSNRQYARERARSTGRAIVLTDLGHVLMDCAHNRAAIEAMGCAVVARFSARPSRSECDANTDLQRPSR